MECLLEQGVDTIFGYPGGQIMPLYDALYDYTEDGRINHILTAHEQGATHAADGFARSTGKVGVVFATSGPGATNTVTGIATANIDSSPIVVITGQVPVASIGKDSFQEVDIIGITYPITKHSFALRDVSEVANAVRQAFQIARSGRPGPVVIDVPKNLMVAEFEYSPSEPLPDLPAPKVSKEEIKHIAELINDAERPVIYAGGGVNISNSSPELTKIAEKAQIPVATTLMCLGCFDRKSPLSLGIAGMHGEREANLAFHNSDLLISIGARFSDRVTGDTGRFAQEAKVVHIDIDRSESGKNIGADHVVIGDIKEVLTALVPLIKKNKRAEWNERIVNWRRALPETDVFDPDTIIRTIHAELGDDTIVATDVGQHQMWTAQKWPFRTPRKLITSGGMGTMGFGLGAAIGAKIANPDRRVVLVTGDGSFRMNFNELVTVASQDLPILVFVLKNATLGMVRQWQKLFFGRRYSATDLKDVVDYTKLCPAFGLTGYEVDSREKLREAIRDAVATGKGAVIACDIETDENVWPIVPPGDAIFNQVMEE
jgi:acetolactate synthase-1/2/3 large subunit